MRTLSHTTHMTSWLTAGCVDVYPQGRGFGRSLSNLIARQEKPPE